LAKPNAVQQLGTDLKLQQSHIAIISETWFSDQHTNDVLSIEGFTLYRRDRSKRRGGGVCAYVLNNIDCSVLPYNNCTDDIEIMWLKCTYNGNIYCIACCYHPPNPHYDRSLFVPSLIHGIDTFSSKYYNEYIIIAGDFNSLDCTALESQCGLVQLVNDPTHCNNILDKVFTNRFDLYSATAGKSLVKTKHHSVLVSAASSTNTPLPRRTRVKVYDLRAHNIDFLRWSISHCDWNPLFASDDVQFIYDRFLSNVQMLIGQCIPAKLVTVGPSDPPYVTPLIVTSA